ncbi:MAG TPA: signal peptide peptidase SppA [Sulfurospirillum sp. UBA12182]|nr:MAG TPA: signal peptide peptidase SppA [Sulfurospirillum sp. UBA12182]
MIFFRFIGRIITYINNHFKAMLFLLLLFLLFNPFGKEALQQANLTTIKLDTQIENIDKLLVQIEEAHQNPHIKGVLLQVDSPGGALAPSIELSMAIKRLNEVKPVIAYASGSMTSGSYYASIWTRKIIANPGAFIGSIGVLFQAPNIEGLAKKLGISEQVITAGAYKQMGTFTRAWNEQEKAALNELIQNAYMLFVSDVASARGLKIEDAKNFADARVFIAHKAMKNGLIDEVGSIYQAQIELEKMANVTNPIWEKPSEMELFLQELKGTNVLNLFNLKSGLR